MNCLSIKESDNDEAVPTDAFFVFHVDHAFNHHPLAIAGLMQWPESRVNIVFGGNR